MDGDIKYCSNLNRDFSERVAYNHPCFPVYVRYDVLSGYPDYSAVSHWHEDLEFILIKKGKMTYNVNGELVELSEKNGIMVNSRQLHYGFSAEHHECEFLCILFSPELLRGNQWFYQTCIANITQNYSYPYLYLDSGGWQQAILDKLEELYRTFIGDVVEASACFQALETFLFIMKILYENLSAKLPVLGKENAELTALRRMITYIEEHYAEPVSLADIALAGTCCKSRCSMLFKKYLRDTPVTYMTKLRLQKSLGALLDSDAGITDIAYENGFCGGSYYCEIFRKYYGISPYKYRKNGGMLAGKE
ncbi:MAG: AraC family transcriptional regulator [Lachnospiraceae bacterium]|nr:AraC family transcriptional regulator [Lachnospiraceae bacterium]